MPRRAQPERSTERTKARLEAAAKSAFAKHGFHGATVQQIATDAGVNVSLINHHFGGKEALYRACLRRFGQERLIALDRFLAPSKTSAEFQAKLQLLVTELLDQHRAEPEILAILLRDVGDPDLWGKELEQQLFGFTTKLAQVFAEAKARGFLRKGIDPLAAATVLYHTFSGLIQFGAHIERVTGLTLDDDTTRRSTIDKALDILFHGVLK
jgi:AcrR family transcriptional regulator